MSSQSAVADPSAGRVTLAFALTLSGLGSALVFGGASIAGFPSDAIAELAALPLLAMALARLAGAPREQLRRSLFPLILLAAIVSLPLVQLVPLPPGLWANLPGRGVVAETLDLIGEPRPWWPLSLDPTATLRSFLSLLPAASVFLAVLACDVRERRLLTLLLAGFAVCTVFLGLAQLAQGEASALRFYTITNRDSSVGLFANRNHHAAFLCAVLPLMLAWTVHFAGRRRSDKQALAIVFALGAILLVLGAAMTLSRAGILLATLAFGSGILLLDFQSAGSPRKPGLRLMAIIGVIALVMIAHYALSGLLLRFEAGDGTDFRFTIWSITREAIWSVFPFGSGFGTFQPLYRLFDRPDALTSAFVNRAHNDWLELILEAGLPGVILMGGFVTWLALAALRVWQRRATGEARLDVALARAATIGVALFLAHSAVDYPLRTISAQTTFAFLCALLVTPVCHVEKPARRRRRSSRRRDSRGGFGGPGGQPPRPRPVSRPPSRPPGHRPSLNWTD